MERPDGEALQKWHSWFAVECNNEAWDTAARGVDATASRQLLLTSYAAAYHWSKVGRPIHQARADMLLARAHAICGHHELARSYAASYLNFCQNNDHEDWDLAFAHAEMAHVFALAADRDAHRHHYESAARLGAQIADEEDRAAFDEEFARIPAP